MASTLAYLEEAERRGAIGHTGTAAGGCCWQCDERIMNELRDAVARLPRAGDTE